MNKEDKFVIYLALIAAVTVITLGFTARSCVVHENLDYCESKLLDCERR